MFEGVSCKSETSSAGAGTRGYIYGKSLRIVLRQDGREYSSDFSNLVLVGERIQNMIKMGNTKKV